MSTHRSLVIKTTKWKIKLTPLTGKVKKQGTTAVATLQGHPMDLFLKISVLQAHFCWLGDVEEIIVLGRKVLLGKR